MSRQPWNHVSEQLYDKIWRRLFRELPINKQLSSELWNQLRPVNFPDDTVLRDQCLVIHDELDRKMK